MSVTNIGPCGCCGSSSSGPPQLNCGCDPPGECPADDVLPDTVVIDFDNYGFVTCDENETVPTGLQVGGCGNSGGGGPGYPCGCEGNPWQILFLSGNPGLGGFDSTGALCWVLKIFDTDNSVVWYGRKGGNQPTGTYVRASPDCYSLYAPCCDSNCDIYSVEVI